jgi:hypothetical protein
MMRRACWGLAGLAVERVVRTGLGVKIVQLVTDDPDAACGVPELGRAT